MLSPQINPAQLAKVQEVTRKMRGRLVLSKSSGFLSLELSTEDPDAQAEVPSLIEQLALSLGQQLSTFFGINGQLVRKE